MRSIKVFIINLARSVDRAENIKACIDELEGRFLCENDGVALEEPKFLNPDRFSLYKRKVIREELILDFYFFRGYDFEHDVLDKIKVNKFKCLYYSSRGMMPGEKGCANSHIALWEECINLNEPVLILEDDVYFNSNFQEGMCEIVRSHFEYVRLCYITQDPIFRLDVGNFFSTHYYLNGAQAYYLTPSAARKFMGAIDRGLTKAIDGVIDEVQMHGVVTVCYYRKLIHSDCDKHPSVIGEINWRNQPHCYIRYRLLKKLIHKFLLIHKNFMRRLYMRRNSLRTVFEQNNRQES